MTAKRKRLRVAVVCDYPEEGWPSMDLTARMTLVHLQNDHADEIEAVPICPRFRHRFGRLPSARLRRVGHNADRLINRFYDYPRALRQIQRDEQFDLFHIVDHSYAQLIHELPAGRTVVTCHDLDTFRCLLHPELEPRPAWFQRITRRVLTGLQATTAVACNSEATRNAILEHGLIPDERLTTNYVGTEAVFSADSDPRADSQLDALIGARETGMVEILHVGSTIPRKRIDVLIDVFASIRQQMPRVRLIKLGGELNSAQRAQAQNLGVADAIHVIPFVEDRALVAALYRRVALVLQPSEAEGFGLPLAEAMGCGAPLLVSDLAIFREVAGEAAIYRSVADIPAWSDAALTLLSDITQQAPEWENRRAIGLERAKLFRWNAHVSRLVDIYRRVSKIGLA